MDLAAANGTIMDGEQLLPFVAAPVKSSSKIKFGASKKEYSISVDVRNDERRKEELYAKVVREDSGADRSDTTVFVA